MTTENKQLNTFNQETSLYKKHFTDDLEFMQSMEKEILIIGTKTQLIMKTTDPLCGGETAQAISDGIEFRVKLSTRQVSVLLMAVLDLESRHSVVLDYDNIANTIVIAGMALGIDMDSLPAVEPKTRPYEELVINHNILTEELGILRKMARNSNKSNMSIAVAYDSDTDEHSLCFEIEGREQMGFKVKGSHYNTRLIKHCSEGIGSISIHAFYQGVRMSSEYSEGGNACRIRLYSNGDVTHAMCEPSVYSEYVREGMELIYDSTRSYIKGAGLNKVLHETGYFLRNRNRLCGLDSELIEYSIIAKRVQSLLVEWNKENPDNKLLDATKFIHSYMPIERHNRIAENLILPCDISPALKDFIKKVHRELLFMHAGDCPIYITHNKYYAYDMDMPKDWQLYKAIKHSVDYNKTAYLNPVEFS